ncbi:unnamed protein product, partial [marine sediment metagenome]
GSSASGMDWVKEFAGVVILLIAFVKVRFVGRYFMELRHAPLGLVAVFDAWIVVVASALIGLFIRFA